MTLDGLRFDETLGFDIDDGTGLRVAHWMSSTPSAAAVARWILLPSRVSKAEELVTAI